MWWHSLVYCIFYCSIWGKDGAYYNKTEQLPTHLEVMWQGQVHLAICLLGLQVVLSRLEASGETLALGIDFPFTIILVILAVNHFSILYLLCFSAVVIKAKPKRHIELSRTPFAEAKDHHAFDKFWTISKTRQVSRHFLPIEICEQALIVLSLSRHCCISTSHFSWDWYWISFA